MVLELIFWLRQDAATEQNIPPIKAQGLQESKRLQRAALCLILAVLHHFDTSVPFCVRTVHGALHQYARLRGHQSKRSKAIIKYAGGTPTVPTGRVPARGHTRPSEAGATRWS